MTADPAPDREGAARRLAALARAPRAAAPPGPRTPRPTMPGALTPSSSTPAPSTPAPSTPLPVAPGSSPSVPRPVRWAPTSAGALAHAAQTVRDPVPQDDCPTAPPSPGRAPGRTRWAVDARTAGAAVGVVALVVGAVVLRAASAPAGEAVALPTPAVSAVLPADAGAAPSAAAPTAPAELLVHVVGAVAHPGVVHLAGGARVADALEAAGGVVDGADPAALNLARTVVDGEQVRVPRVGEVLDPPVDPVQAPATGGQDGAPVDLNTADQATLEGLPGVGPVLAGRIVEGRPYASVDDLDDVPGIGPTLMADLRDRVRV